MAKMMMIMILMESLLIISAEELRITTLKPDNDDDIITTTTNTITMENDIIDGYDYNNLNEYNCGRRMNNRHPKIINGSNAIHGNYPWMISLLLNNRHHCGGSLINNRWVLTAAHCVYRVPSPRFQVKLGSHVRINNNSEPMSIFLDNVRAIPHPGFTFTTFQDDLALIRLPKAIRYSNYIQPICLPDRIWMKPMVRKATVIGWGKLKQGGNSADTLQQVDLPIIDNGKCINWYREMGKMLTIRPTQICAGFEQGGKDACQGDSGSPMLTTNDFSKRSTIIGIVSAGIGCALPKLPGIYTRVSAYLPWIRETMQRYDDERRRPPLPKLPLAATTESSPMIITTEKQSITTESTDITNVDIDVTATKEPEHDNLWALVSPPPPPQPPLSNELMESEQKKLWALITAALINNNKNKKFDTKTQIF